MDSIARFAAALLLLPLIAAAWFSIQLARADYQFRLGTPETVARARELAPLNTDYMLLRAMQLDYAGADATTLLERAAVTTPMNAVPLIRLGLAAEIRGDFPAAEKYLLDAAGLNRQFEPRWTLANFYFRRANADEFWRWIHSALDVSYGDRRPSFDLCWNVSSDPNEIFTRAIPDRRDVLGPYLEYLNETHRSPAMPAVALKLASVPNPQDRPLLLKTVDALIDAKDASSAAAVWRALGYPNPAGVFRGDFQAPEARAGFDWRYTSAQGITRLPIDQPRSMMRISLDGSEPESVELLRQVLSLEPGVSYKLTWQSRAQDLASPSGIEWRIGDQHAPLASGELPIVAPSSLAPLILFYARPSGETRAEGSLELWNVAITRN